MDCVWLVESNECQSCCRKRRERIVSIFNITYKMGTSHFFGVACSSYLIPAHFALSALCRVSIRAVNEMDPPLTKAGRRPTDGVRIGVRVIALRAAGGGAVSCHPTRRRRQHAAAHPVRIHITNPGTIKQNVLAFYSAGLFERNTTMLLRLVAIASALCTSQAFTLTRPSMVPVSTLKTTPLAMRTDLFCRRTISHRRRKIVIDYWPRAILTASSLQASRTQLSLISAAEMDLIIGR